MVEMELTEETVIEVLFFPEVDTASRPRGSTRENRRASAGEIAVTYDWDGPARIVITVLPRTQEQYVRKDAQ